MPTVDFQIFGSVAKGNVTSFQAVLKLDVLIIYKRGSEYYLMTGTE